MGKHYIADHHEIKKLCAYILTTAYFWDLTVSDNQNWNYLILLYHYLQFTGFYPLHITLTSTHVNVCMFSVMSGTKNVFS